MPAQGGILVSVWCWIETARGQNSSVLGRVSGRNKTLSAQNCHVHCHVVFFDWNWTIPGLTLTEYLSLLIVLHCHWPDWFWIPGVCCYQIQKSFVHVRHPNVWSCRLTAEGDALAFPWWWILTLGGQSLSAHGRLSALDGTLSARICLLTADGGSLAFPW